MNSKQQAAIHSAWLDAALSSFFPNSEEAFRNASGFGNPVGQAFHQGMDAILAGLEEQAELEAFRAPLDRMIRVLAIQGLPAGTAVRLLYLLKDVLRTVSDISMEERHQHARKLDRLAEIAAEVWSDCREKLLQIQIEQLRRHIRLLETVSTANEKGGTV
jgi:hypothetical protein